MGKRWLPLESNPEVLNDFATKIGMAQDKFKFCDVFGMDQELLDMVPKPVLATLLLFPLTKAAEAAKNAEEKTAVEAGGRPKGPEDLYFMQQTIGNACGTIGLLHALANVRDSVSLEEGSFLERFFTKTKSLSPTERGQELEYPSADGPDIDSAHAAAANEGNTRPPPLGEVVSLHFVALVVVEGQMWELDGRKSGPVSHGPASRDTILQDTKAVLHKFMDTAGGDINFNLIALANADNPFA